MSANQIAYTAALDVFRAASASFRETQKAYLQGEITDFAFLTAKKIFALAQDRCDAAERLYCINFGEEK